MTMRKVLQEILEKNPRFHHLTPLKTKHIAHWCRCHGYTPPDPETLRSDGDSIEDVLTQIDSEPGMPSVGIPGSVSSLRGGFMEQALNSSASKVLGLRRVSPGGLGEQGPWLTSSCVFCLLWSQYSPYRTICA